MSKILIFDCVMIGGPFDGDAGSIDELPPYLWVARCPSPFCLIGIHWTWPEAWPDVVSERYVRAADEDVEGVHAYVFSAIGDDLPPLEVSERSIEPALA